MNIFVILSPSLSFKDWILTLYSHFKNINQHHLFLLIILWTIVHSLLFWHYGIRNLYDSGEYINRAEFIRLHYRLEDFREIFYAIPISIIALFRWIFQEPIIPYLIFQSVISGLATLALYLASSKIFNSALAGLCTGIIFLLWWDNLQWNVTLMTESLACSFICFLIFKLCYFQASRKDYVYTITLLILICIIRPTGVIIVIGAAAFLLSYHWENFKHKPYLKVIVITSLILITCIAGYFMLNQWDFTEQHKKGNIVTYIDTIEKRNPFYSECLRLDVQHIKFANEHDLPAEKMFFLIIHNPVYFVKSAFLKIAYLVTNYRPYYSSTHNIYILTWIVCIYITSFMGWHSTSYIAVRLFILVVIVANCSLIAIATIDWDNRFYIPMEPGLVILSGGGLVKLIDLIKLNKFHRLYE